MVITGIADFARPASQLSRNNATSLKKNRKKEATQEATVIAGILNKQATGNGNVIFSKVGGGVFRKVSHWLI